MQTPTGWIRRKLHGGIQNQIDAALKDVNERIEQLREEIVCGTLNTRIDELTTATSAHLNTVDHLAQATNAIALDLAGRLDSTNQISQDTANRLEDVIHRIESLNADLKIQASRIRANPFSQDVLQIASKPSGRLTLGFESNVEGAYIDFANTFRPSFDDLVIQLRGYIAWLPSEGVGIDLGAGRGEMVSVMSSHGLSAYGVDSDLSMTKEAKSRNIDVRHDDIDNLFNKLTDNSVVAITAIQVVEHVDTPTLEKWFYEVKRVLKPGGVFIAETPNPHAIDAFKAFWVDVTHVRPYYPESLLHMAHTTGFSRAEIWVEGDDESVYDRLGLAGSYTIIATA